VALIDRIKHEEGFKSHPYKDAVGKLTIGYGSTLHQTVPVWLRMNAKRCLS